MGGTGTDEGNATQGPRVNERKRSKKSVDLPGLLSLPLSRLIKRHRNSQDVTEQAQTCSNTSHAPVESIALWFSPFTWLGLFPVPTARWRKDKIGGTIIWHYKARMQATLLDDMAMMDLMIWLLLCTTKSKANANTRFEQKVVALSTRGVLLQASNKRGCLPKKTQSISSGPRGRTETQRPVPPPPPPQFPPSCHQQHHI
jgi:hypothetical protein